MAYAQQSDLELAAGGPERFRQLADFDSDGTADPVVIARAQAAADSFIDPYLATRVATPVAAPWPELVTLSADEAIYQIKRWRGLNYVTDSDTKGREDRENTLKLYSSGLKRPPDPQPAQSSGVRAAWVASDVDTAPVSRCGTKGVW